VLTPARGLLQVNLIHLRTTAAFPETLPSAPVTERFQTQTRLDERARLRAAAIELVAERGRHRPSLELLAECTGLALPDVRRHYRTFQDCIDDAWDHATAEFTRGLEASNAGTEPWVDRLRRSAYFVLRFFTEDMVRTRFFAIMMRSPGDLAQARIYRMIELGVELVDAGRHQLPDPDAVPRSRAEGAVGAIYEAIVSASRKGPPELGAELLPQLMYIAVMPYLGLDAADAELRRGPEDLARFQRGEL
jgi:AcrR family transcriptional regulator